MEASGHQGAQEAGQGETAAETAAFTARNQRGSSGRQSAARPHPVGSGQLRVLYTNARSLQSKMQELELLAHECNADLILVTETWCNSDISDTALNIPGYFFDPEMRFDRTDTTKGIGGVDFSYSSSTVS